MSEKPFHVSEGKLYCEECLLERVAASVPTPFYVYSSRDVVDKFRKLDAALSAQPHLICYALKANSQAALLRLLVKEGAGAEVVSGGELELALRVGVPPDRIVFSGVGKAEWELEAGVKADVLLFHLESEGEAELLDRVAARNDRRVRVSVRINPDIDAETHRHIATGVQTAKFGLDSKTAMDLYRRRDAFPHLDFCAIHAHIGSQITSLEPLGEAARMLGRAIGELKAQGVTIHHVDIGGGLGIAYGEDPVPEFEAYAQEVLPWLSRSGARVVVEPGRALVGSAGAFVAKVLYVKRVHGKRFVIVDAGMNDLMRPALYDAYHRIVPLAVREGREEKVDVVGAVCETSDTFGRDRRLVDPKPGDLLGILDTGAYGYAMSSNYNLRPRPAEVLVEGETFRVVRAAETVERIVSRELEEGS
jgi:diaminopimelate decarboxylase